LFQDADKFRIKIENRLMPVEKSLIKDIRSNIIKTLINEKKIENCIESDIEKMVNLRLNSKLNQWYPIKYKYFTNYFL
jgi:hypothetical protein